ncbi:hypothetical protein LXL04_032382 [Taraxacum kok-saghyz]
MADTPTHCFKFIRPGFKFDLSIPSSFLMNLNGGRCSEVTLRRERHVWSVAIDDGVFGDGWRMFLRENGVQEFDFIVFKHQGGMMFDFLVFDQSTCERQYPNISDEMDVEERPVTVSETIRTNTSSTLNSHPYFISNLKPSSFKKSFLHLPSHFMKGSGLKTGEMILIDDEDRSWKVQLNKVKKDNEFYHLGIGLRAFLVANEYKVGDAFKFEVLEKEKKKPPVVKFSCTYGLTPTKEDGRRYFMCELNSRNIQHSALYLPREFARWNGLLDKEKIILKNAEDQSWTVEVRNGKSSYYMAGGWNEFRVANGLKEGDCFKMEVVDKGEVPILNFYLEGNC